MWLALRDLQPGILDYAGTAPAHAAEITIQADLLPAPVRGEIGGLCSIEDGPAPTPISRWESIFSLLSSKCSEEPAFLASSLVELAVKHHLSAEERPLASLGRKHSDLLFVAFFVVELRHTGRPGIAQGSHWRGAVFEDRAIFGLIRAPPNFTVPKKWKQPKKSPEP